MENLTQHLLINGKMCWFLSKEGIYYIAIKPICEALQIDYIEQFKNLKEDEILSSVLCKHTIQIPNDQGRSLICLPEEYIYGWLFSIKPINPIPEFIEYKRKCYHILFNHFHGSLTAIQQSLVEKTSAHSRIEEIEESLRKDSELYNELEELKAKEMRIGKNIKQQLDDIAHGQMMLNFQ